MMTDLERIEHEERKRRENQAGRTRGGIRALRDRIVNVITLAPWKDKKGKKHYPTAGPVSSFGGRAYVQDDTGTIRRAIPKLRCSKKARLRTRRSTPKEDA